MTTMSEIVLVDSAGGLTCQGAVASVHGDNYTVRFRRGCHRYRWQVLSALGRRLVKVGGYRGLKISLFLHGI